MEKKYLEQINKIIENYRKEGVEHKDCNCAFDDRDRLVRMCLSCNDVRTKSIVFEKELDKKFSELNLQKPKLTVNKSDKVFEHIENDFTEINGVKISNEIFELGYFISVDKGKIAIFKK